MREMKDSGIEWIGQIPKGWELRRAKTLFTQRNSKGNGIEVLLSPTQKYGVVPQSQLEGVVQVKEDTDLQMFKTVHKGDFVISLRSFQGGFEYSLYEGVCSPAYQVFYPTSPICDTYYRYLFKSQSFISKMNNLTVGIREGKNIQYVDFANSQIPVPPLAEQEHIAAFLDAECAEIDAVLEKTRASIEEYKKLKQAVITQAVTKGIRGNRPMKDSGIEWIGEIPAEWEIKRIKNICSLKTGSTPSTGNAEWFNGDLLWFTPGDFNEKFVLLLSNRTLSRTAEKDGVATMIPANSVLVVCIGGSAGKVGYTNYGCSCNQQITALCKSNIMPKLLMYDVNAGMPFLRNTTMFTTLPILNNQAIGGLVLPIPRKEEQLSIIEYLDEKCAGIDALIAKKQQYLTEIENYKKSLIYEYVTGKKEVKTSVLAD